MIGVGLIGCVAFRCQTRMRTMLGSIGGGNQCATYRGVGLGGSTEQAVGILEVRVGTRNANPPTQGTWHRP